mmetsp:Transcript_103525/g.259553  ORF Transcript_103525/g.259553 Transcript_103525/m.259553 type:complete len:536 (-) Transcript_103525:82-1689(-)
MAAAASRSRLSNATAAPASSSSGDEGSVDSLDRLPQLEERVHIQGAVKIGSGNLGVVLLVQDRQNLGRKIAVKVISLKLVRDTGSEEARVWREVQIMRDLGPHPHMVQLVDVLASWQRVPHVAGDPPHVCIAMEYIADSEPLSNVLRRCGSSPTLASQVLPQLADALSLMHQTGLVHRDVWSENVLVSERTGRAVLVDLGCAEYVSSESAVTSKLNIPYMSPEAAQGLQQAPGDDCWALGLVLSEMLTGRFVADRLGRSDLPIHYNMQVLSETVSEAAVKGGPLLGSICTHLLDMSAEQRSSMAEVVARCQCQSQANGAANVAGGSPRQTSGRLQSAAFQTPVPVSALPKSTFQPRRVPSSALVPSAPGPQVWQIVPGAVAVQQPSLSRGISASQAGAAAAAGPMPARTALVAPSQVSGGALLGVAGSTAAGNPRPAGPCAHARQEPLNAGSLMTVAAATVPTKGPPPKATIPQVPVFSIGQRVAYTARSNGQRYSGTILGRLAGNTGWQIALDVGEKKDVENKEVWRLTPLQVG